MKRILSLFFLLVIVTGFSSMACAAAPASQQAVQNPVKLIDQTVLALQKEISEKGASLSNSPRQLFELVKKIVMPYVNVDQMAGLVLGPKWRSATEQQKQEFIDAFGLLLTRTYANALLTVSDYQITVYPLRGNGWKTAQYVAIHGTVKPKNGGAPSDVTYYLERSGDSWKIYDLAVEGVSFMQNFRSQFQSFADMAAILTRLNELNSRY